MKINKMKRIHLLMVTATIATWALYGCERRNDPTNVIFQQLRASVPREKIVFAKRIGGRHEPTFIGIILTDKTTQATLDWMTLGCVPVSYEPQKEQARRTIFHHFGDRLTSTDLERLRSSKVCVGTLREGPYYISALVADTNAYIVLQRY